MRYGYVCAILLTVIFCESSCNSQTHDGVEYNQQNPAIERPSFFSSSSDKEDYYRDKLSEKIIEIGETGFFNKSSISCDPVDFSIFPEPDYTCDNSRLEGKILSCKLLGLGEHACGEIIEGMIEETGRRPYAGAEASGACSLLFTLSQNGEVDERAAIRSAMLGGIDNFGESQMEKGGLFNSTVGLIARGSVALVKINDVGICIRKSELSCNPEEIEKQKEELQKNHDKCESLIPVVLNYKELYESYI